MASDSVTSFLDLARTNRLLLPELVEDLAQKPDTPQNNLTELCHFLESKGLLTPFQAGQVREGRGASLTFAGYPITAQIGPCPGGMAYRALHPSLRTPLILRQLRTEWFAPDDNAAAYVQRAQAAAPLVHSHLAQLLDAGVFQDIPYVTQEPIEGDNLFALVQDIGAMPTALATLYIVQAAQALSLAHSRGLVHGHVGPGMMVVGPLVPMNKRRADGTPKMRPGPDAKLVLTELGLVPKRPALRSWASSSQAPPLELAFLAPERLDQAEPTPAGDIYSLGASFYYLLAAHAPTPCRTTTELLAALEWGMPPSLASVRPDLPHNLVKLIEAMMARDPGQRPNLPNILHELQPHIPLNATPAPDEVPASNPVDSERIESEPVQLSAAVPPEELATLKQADEPEALANLESASVDYVAMPFSGEQHSGIGTFTPESYDGSSASSTDLATMPPIKPDASWPGFSGENKSLLQTPGWPGFQAGPDEPPMGEPAPEPWEGQPVQDEHPDPLIGDPAADDATPRPPRQQRTPEVSKGKMWMWIGVGAGLQVLAILGWVYLAMSPGCHSTPQPAPVAPKKGKN